MYLPSPSLDCSKWLQRHWLKPWCFPAMELDSRNLCMSHSLQSPEVPKHEEQQSLAVHLIFPSMGGWDREQNIVECWRTKQPHVMLYWRVQIFQKAFQNEVLQRCFSLFKAYFSRAARGVTVCTLTVWSTSKIQRASV